MATTNHVLNKLSVAPKEVSYLNKSFTDFKGDLITFVKNYYPTTWTDFNEANPGMIMLELAAYVGDVFGVKVFVSTNADTAAGTSGTDRICLLAHKDAFVLAEQMGVRSQTQYKQEYLGTLFTSDMLYGVAELRDGSAVALAVPA